MDLPMPKLKEWFLEAIIQGEGIKEKYSRFMAIFMLLEALFDGNLKDEVHIFLS